MSDAKSDIASGTYFTDNPMKRRKQTTTDEKIKELLVVLDNKNPIKTLQGWAWRNNRDLWQDLDGGGFREISNADLAFRLRDEAVKTCRYKYDDAIIQVYSVSKKSAEEFHWWWIRHSQPIHIIIAALIAKELAKES